MDDLALPSAGLPDGTGGACLFGLSLCSGAGGIDLGLTIALPGYRTVGHVERETYAAATLVARMEDASLDQAVVWDDVASFDGRPWRGAVDIVTAGYPCQPFSVAGKRRGADDPRHLWPHVARIIGEVEPPFVFLENVAHHLRLGFPEVAAGLVGMGYRLAADLFTAAEVGAPHKRERLFILAIRAGDELADPTRLLWNPVEWREPDGTAAALANTPRQRQREPADETDALAGSGSARDESGDDGCNVADTADRQLSKPGRRAEGRKGSGPNGAGLADPDGNRRKQAERGQSPDGKSYPCQSDVDDANGTGSQGWRNDAGKHAGERPAWPPGPGDADGWAEFLRCAPDLEPAVRRGADGLAHRVDRLRLCGNGVVPLVAAHALRTLAAELLADR
ncbi:MULTISPECIES: DNA cytosine methyltransferase [unclassified Paracoccus (in: a-proteobacteria)]|uniref:DNA cytosine methyltransferase n=1 Tax=unclassified Paracoccus (in: a-proteobacteria) TaxID=2688777 RepID=UPI0012B1AFCD|nr:MULTISPECIES: DNA cytosine methyltransferase [unclassified Paracoccus (in: a-proteobacteria)]UXU74147.1 DNA cytosine methyltransferase [Paracoccus sp. SMMA_5]UXU80037.1 DNA cytosine methyltransferase [Paracoccus sp. SMMA_5_TC]